MWDDDMAPDNVNGAHHPFQILPLQILQRASSATAVNATMSWADDTDERQSVAEVVRLGWATAPHRARSGTPRKQGDEIGAVSLFGLSFPVNLVPVGRAPAPPVWLTASGIFSRGTRAGQARKADVTAN